MVIDFPPPRMLCFFGILDPRLRFITEWETNIWIDARIPPLQPRVQRPQCRYARRDDTDGYFKEPPDPVDYTTVRHILGERLIVDDRPDQTEKPGENAQTHENPQADFCPEIDLSAPEEEDGEGGEGEIRDHGNDGLCEDQSFHCFRAHTPPVVVPSGMEWLALHDQDGRADGIGEEKKSDGPL